MIYSPPPGLSLKDLRQRRFEENVLNLQLEIMVLKRELKELKEEFLANPRIRFRDKNT